MVLPHGGEEGDELPDPRDELVQRLLGVQEVQRRRQHARRAQPQLAGAFSAAQRRLAAARGRNLADEEIREVELWDLVSAFGRIMRDNQAVQPSNIVYDDTPIHVYMAQIQARLAGEGRLSFQKLFHEGMHKSALVGVFLAVLELVRNYHVRTEQNDLFGEIWILPGEAAAAEIDPAQVDNYDRSSPKAKSARRSAKPPALPASESRGRKKPTMPRRPIRRPVRKPPDGADRPARGCLRARAPSKLAGNRAMRYADAP